MLGVLAALPEDTGLVVQDANGQALSLASKAAAAAIVKGDPVWCPNDAASITPGSNRCTGTFSSLTALKAALETDALLASPVYFGAGTIYIASDYTSSAGDSGNDITFNHNTLSQLTALVVQGGWNSSNASKAQAFTTSTISLGLPADGTDYSHYGLNFTNWNAALTLNDLIIDSSSGGLTVLGGTSNNDVTLNNISVSNSGRGAVLGNVDAINAAEITTAGNVTINNSTFSNNQNDGLRVETTGSKDVVFNQVSASNNTGNGAEIVTNDIASTITFTGENTFSTNSLNGVSIQSKGNVTADDSSAITASHNSMAGFLLYNNDGQSLASRSDVSLLGTNIFNDDWAANSPSGNFALYIVTNGDITLNNVQANGSGYGGASLFNTLGTTNNYIQLSGDNQFNGNGWTDGGFGLQAESLGDILIGASASDTFQANSNSGDSDLIAGLSIDNCMDDGSGCTGTGNFVIQGSNNEFNGTTYGYGLQIFSNGTITLENTTANDNSYDGAYLDNCIYSSNDAACTGSGSGGVTLNGENTFNGNGWDNYNNGLTVYSFGAVSLHNTTASGNGNDGVFIDNTGFMGYENDGVTPIYAGSGTVAINGTNTFTENNYHGLEVYAGGSITLNDVTGDGNGADGAYLDNCSYDPNDWYACLRSDAFDVTLTGTNEFNDNNQNDGNDGLEIYTLGAIDLNNVTVDGNWGGAYLSNCSYYVADFVTEDYSSGCGSTGSVTLSGANSFSGNYGNGLEVYGAKDVTFNDTVVANGNEGSGVDISTYGKVTINDLEASDNKANGLSLDNCQQDGPTCAGSGDVILNGDFLFDQNFNVGLDIKTGGNIISNASSTITATGTTNNVGAALTSVYNGGKSINLAGTNVFSGNDGNGFFIQTQGAVTLNNVTADGNTWGGIYINSCYDDSGCTGQGDVTFSGTNDFSGNTGGKGLLLYSNGNVTLNNVTADNNLEQGVLIDNCDSTSGNCNPSGNVGGKVVLKGVNSMNNNGGSNLEIYANGDITISGTTADPSARDGFILKTSKDIYICNSLLKDNSGYGINADLPGILTLSNVLFSGNTLGDTNLTGGGTIVVDDTYSCTHAPTPSPTPSPLPSPTPSPLPSPTPSPSSSATPEPAPSLPWNIVPTGGAPAVLTCNGFVGTKLTLSDGNFAQLPCPIADTGSLNPETSASLPGALPGGMSFLSALSLGISSQGKSLGDLEQGAVVAFNVPTGADKSKLAILWWDGSKWVKLGGYTTPDGHFNVVTHHTGTFVLVQQ